jgi:type IV secretory pathway VirB2 component (pilin)
MKGLLKSVFAPVASAVVTINVVGMGLETMRQGQIINDFRDVSHNVEGIAIMVGVVAAGITGYLFGKTSLPTAKPKPPN